VKDRHALAGQDQAPWIARDERADVDSRASGVDIFEVPAAVLCAVCGHADCEGCRPGDHDGPSGVIAIVPWERREGSGAWQRLWSTARSTTTGAEYFFTALPRGPIGAALTFALVAEALAVSSMAGALLVLASIVMPDLVLGVLLDFSADGPELLHWLATATPALAVWMVVVHVVHGLAVDSAARRAGAVSNRNRALRFGLYACGWDVMTSPLGALVTLLSQGPRAMLALAGCSLSVPSRGTMALLRGVYGLDEDQARSVHRRAAFLAVCMVVVTALIVIPLLLLA
jgi:hypothetical protein